MTIFGVMSRVRKAQKAHKAKIQRHYSSQEKKNKFNLISESPTAVLVGNNAAAGGAGVGSQDNAVLEDDRTDSCTRLRNLQMGNTA